MKAHVAPYQTAAWCVRIVCRNGTVVRMTTYPVDLAMSNGQIYKTDSGYEQTAYTAGSDFSPSVVDISGFVGVAGITRDQLASGVFDNARVHVFKTDFLNPVEDEEEVTLGFFGKTTRADDRYTVESMSLVDVLNQGTGKTLTPGCINTLGDDNCGISIPLIQKTGTVTSVTSRFVIRDSSRTEAADWFAAGTVAFSSGQNAGLKALEIKEYAADGTITTFEPFYYTPQVGDGLVLVPGCRRRLEDCRDKWANVAVNNGVHALKVVPNNGGFFGVPNMPTESVYTQVGDNR
jgi:uncharacterized phage protein (TIGR02218 family)